MECLLLIDKQLTKWIRENLPEVDHRYDVWHVSSVLITGLIVCYIHGIGFRKKVEKLAKKSGCEEIGGWIRSMVNHLYWSAMSTEDGDPDVIIEKWQSLGNTFIVSIMVMAKSTKSLAMVV